MLLFDSLQKNPYLSEDDDDEPLVGIEDLDDLNPPSKSDKKKKKRKRSETPSSDSNSDSNSNSSNSSDSESDSDSDIDSDDVSSVASDEIDLDQFLPNSHDQPSPSPEPNLTTTNLNDLSVVYRATRRFNVPLGQVQAPCGQCPVFAFCDESGPVDPVGCKYFGDWLGDVVGGWDRVGLDLFRGDRDDVLEEPNEDMIKVDEVDEGDEGLEDIEDYGGS
jgi:DNA-directed RNA polymerase III subunit RPC6